MLGKRLLELRKANHLTQDELAAILRINKHSISSYERDINEPSDDIKIQIANYFHVTVDYLVGLTDDPQRLEPGCEQIILPADLPAAARESIKNYAAYVFEKYR